MAKRNRKKRMKKRRRQVKPDEYYSHGPIEMARYGNGVIMRNNMSDEQFTEYQKSLADAFPDACLELDKLTAKIASIVSTLDPLRLLNRAHWNYIHSQLGLSKKGMGNDSATALRMIDYLQSVVAATEPADSVLDDVTDEIFDQLATLVERLFISLGANYQISRTANEIVSNPDYSLEFDAFYSRAQMHWCMVRGDRHQAHEIAHHKALLEPHEEIISELFGVSVDELLVALQAIMDGMNNGVISATEEMNRYQGALMNAFAQKVKKEGKTDKSRQEILGEVISENDWEAWGKEVAEKFSGHDLFDLEKITTLPKTFLEAFSWKQGEELDFFAGEMPGWPLKIWPVFKRPFLEVDGRHYCFECHSLFDNLYRCIQREIFARKAEYKRIWSSKQKEISENLPVQFLKEILPGATVFQSVFYKLPKKQWAEVDALVAYEDHLFIVEVKAGAFTYTSPATDFPAYIDSIKALVYKPAKQGMRFRERLLSQEKMSLFDEKHNEVGTLSLADFEHVSICAVTLDSFTEIAAQPEQLKGLGIDVGDYPIWSMSIDDLRVYSEIFSNPLQFLHYAEERNRAFSTSHMLLHDELDHLGLYLKHNIYTRIPLGLEGAEQILCHGFSKPIDDFYSQKLEDPDTPCPLRQDMPSRLNEILELLAKSEQKGRRLIASLLLNCGGKWRNNITATIDKVLARQLKSKTIQPISTIGDTKLSITCWDERVSEYVENYSKDNAYATMTICDDSDRASLELFFDSDNRLIDLQFELLSIKNLPTPDHERINALASKLKRQRWGKAAKTGKIGRNQSCPCGSGRKFKKCCRIY